MYIVYFTGGEGGGEGFEEVHRVLGLRVVLQPAGPRPQELPQRSRQDYGGR